jgi:hypothetical protein
VWTVACVLRYDVNVATRHRGSGVSTAVNSAVCTNATYVNNSLFTNVTYVNSAL